MPPLLFAAPAVVYVFLHWRAIYVAPSFDDWAVIAIWRDAVRHAAGLDVLVSVFQGTTGDFCRPLTNFTFALVNGESAFLPQALKLLAIVGMAAPNTSAVHERMTAEMKVVNAAPAQTPKGS